jgi:ribonuclease D
MNLSWSDILCVVIDRGEQTSNWVRRPLAVEQLRYAALDAEVLLALHSVLAPRS